MKGGCLTLSVRQSLFLGGACLRTRVGYGAAWRPHLLEKQAGTPAHPGKRWCCGGGQGVFGEFCGKKCIIMRFLVMNYLVESENCCIFASERVVFALGAGGDACAPGQALRVHNWWGDTRERTL